MSHPFPTRPRSAARTFRVSMGYAGQPAVELPGRYVELSPGLLVPDRSLLDLQVRDESADEIEIALED